MKADTILSAMSAIRWAHIIRQQPIDAFSSPLIKLTIDGIRRVQGNYGKKKAEPLSKDQLRRITSPAPAQSSKLTEKQLDDLNTDTAYKCAFAGFLRTGEVTYERKDLANKPLFERNHILRRDVHFSDTEDHVVLSLRATKVDTKYSGVEIVLASEPHSPTCPVQALRRLMQLDPQPGNAPLFRHSSGDFSRAKYIDTLRSRLRAKGFKGVMVYSGHSFRRGAAQHASDNGLLDEDIQRLGRWSSDAFKGYFSFSLYQKFLLNRRFLTGRLSSLSSRT